MSNKIIFRFIFSYIFRYFNKIVLSMYTQYNPSIQYDVFINIIITYWEKVLLKLNESEILREIFDMYNHLFVIRM